MNGFWITIGDLAAATGVEDQTIRKRVLQNQYQTTEQPSPIGGGQAGMIKIIDFYSLPEDEQSQYLEFYSRISSRQPEIQIPIDILQYQSEEGQEELAKVLLRVSACKEIIGLQEQRIRKKDMKPYIEKWLDKLGGITRTHLNRLIAKYEQGGTGALFRPERRDKGKRREVCEAASNLLKYIYLSEKKLSYKQSYEEALREAEHHGKEYCQDCACSAECDEDDDSRNGLKLGAYKTATRVLSELTNSEKAMFRGGREAWRKNYMVKARIRRDDIPVNGQWVGDHHVFDCYARNDEGWVGRPWITAWQDRRSGVITGYALSFLPNSQTIAAALVHGMKQKPDSPFHGKPEQILIDNGKDYRSQFLNGSKQLASENPEFYRQNCKGLFNHLGIDVRFARPYTPWAKIIERFFGTLADRFTRLQPSWLGRNQAERPSDWNKQIKELKDSGAIPTLEELQQELELYLAEFHNTFQNDLGATPLQVYQTTERYEAPIPSNKALAVLLLNEVERKIHPTGFQINNRHYANETELAIHVGSIAQIRFDPLHYQESHVFISGKYICTAPLRVDLSTRSGKEFVSDHIANQRRAEADIKDRQKNYAAKAGKTKSKKVVTGETLPGSGSKVVAMTGLEKVPLSDQNKDQQTNNLPPAPEVDSFRAMLRSMGEQGRQQAQERQERQRSALAGQAASR